MPNISFDIFYDLDFINVTATRSGAAPKAKPAWKVRTAPKLPPKELPAPDPTAPRPAGRPTINAQRAVASGARKVPKLGPKKQDTTDQSDASSIASKPAKRAPPKLKDLEKGPSAAPPAKK